MERGDPNAWLSMARHRISPKEQRIGAAMRAAWDASRCCKILFAWRTIEGLLGSVAMAAWAGSAAVRTADPMGCRFWNPSCPRSPLEAESVVLASKRGKVDRQSHNGSTGRVWESRECVDAPNSVSSRCACCRHGPDSRQMNAATPTMALLGRSIGSRGSVSAVPAVAVSAVSVGGRCGCSPGAGSWR